MARDEWTPGAPRPGDPAASGPRPRGRWRDGAWLALAVGLATVTAAQLVRLVVALLTDPAVRITGGRAVLGFVITVVWLLTIFWLTAGAWRRTVWGCPFEHVADAAWERRCARHALLPAPEPHVGVADPRRSDPTGAEGPAPGPERT